MREYECLYVLNPKLEDEDITALNERFSQVMTELGGEILTVNPWGKRRLAYEIAHQKEGFYVQMRFNCGPDAPKEFDQALRFSESVMRHIIVRADELDPAATDKIPEQLPEPGSDEGDYRRGHRGDRSHQEAKSAEAEQSTETAHAGEKAEETAAEPAEGEQEASVSEEAAPAEEATSAEEAPVVEETSEAVETAEAPEAAEEAPAEEVQAEAPAEAEESEEQK